MIRKTFIMKNKQLKTKFIRQIVNDLPHYYASSDYGTFTIRKMTQKEIHLYGYNWNYITELNGSMHQFQLLCKELDEIDLPFSNWIHHLQEKVDYLINKNSK